MGLKTTGEYLLQLTMLYGDKLLGKLKERGKKNG
jgi:hypothetical protein